MRSNQLSYASKWNIQDYSMFSQNVNTFFRIFLQITVENRRLL